MTSKIVRELIEAADACMAEIASLKTSIEEKTARIAELETCVTNLKAENKSLSDNNDLIVDAIHHGNVMDERVEELTDQVEGLEVINAQLRQEIEMLKKPVRITRQSGRK